jgi:hypothetical protein
MWLGFIDILIYNRLSQTRTQPKETSTAYLASMLATTLQEVSAFEATIGKHGLIEILSIPLIST